MSFIYCVFESVNEEMKDKERTKATTGKNFPFLYIAWYLQLLITLLFSRQIVSRKVTPKGILKRQC